MLWAAYMMAIPTGNPAYPGTANARRLDRKFWLSVLFTWCALYSAEHSAYFASPEYFEKGDGNAVIEEVSVSSNARQISLLLLTGLGAAFAIAPSALPLTPQKGLLAVAMLLSVLLIASVAWADDVAVSFKRAVQPILLLLAALGIAKQLHPRQVCTLCAILAAAFLMLGVGATLIQGTLLKSITYRFGGTLHPNTQAVQCTFLVLAGVAMISDKERTRRSHWLAVTAMAAGLLFLLLTRSRTGLLTLGAGMLMFFFVGARPARKLSLIAIVAGIFAAGLFLALLPGSGFGDLLRGAVQMGRSEADISSLTGRIPIWQAVIRDIGDSPWLGYGFGAFWTPQRIWEYSQIHRWEFNHAHSAYLETWLNVGIVGLLLGLLLLVTTMNASLKAFRVTRDDGYRFVVAIVMAALVNGLLDSTFVVVGLAPFVVMLCVATVALRSGRLAAKPAAAACPSPYSAPPFQTALNY